MFWRILFLILIPYSLWAQLPVTAGLVHHIDAQDVNGDGTTPSDGATLANWTDLSPSNLDLGIGSQNLPIYDEDGWNPTCPAIRFGLGGNTQLAGGDPFGGTQTQSTIFLYHKEASRRRAMTVAFNGDTSFSRSYILTWINGFIYQRIENVWIIINPAVPVGNSLLSTFYHSQTPPNRRYIRTNGLQNNNNSANSVATGGGIRLGSGWNNIGGTQYWFDGWVAEMIIYDRPLSPAEVALVEDYIRDRWLTCDNTVDLEVKKQAFYDAACTNPVPPNLLDEDEDFFYCVKVKNMGSTTATNIVLEDNVPDGLTVNGASATSGTVTITP